jgi:hypothetical protein
MMNSKKFSDSYFIIHHSYFIVSSRSVSYFFFRYFKYVITKIKPKPIKSGILLRHFAIGVSSP